MREHDTKSVLTDFSEDVFEITREVPVALIEVHKKWTIRFAPPFRMEKKRAHQRPAEQIGVAFVNALAA
jgi:hypothetical protein